MDMHIGNKFKAFVQIYIYLHLRGGIYISSQWIVRICVCMYMYAHNAFVFRYLHIDIVLIHICTCLFTTPSGERSIIISLLDGINSFVLSICN